MWHLTAYKISVTLGFELEISYRISELMLAIISFQERETNWNFTGCQMPHFMIVLILYINLLNLSWMIKCLFLRNREPLKILLYFSTEYKSIRQHFTQIQTVSFRYNFDKITSFNFCETVRSVPLIVARVLKLKGLWYTFRGGNCQTVWCPTEKRSTIIGNNLLPVGANSFLLE